MHVKKASFYKFKDKKIHISKNKLYQLIFEDVFGKS